MRTFRTLVTGISGTGKTRLSKQLLRPVNRLIFVDPLQEWGDECQAVFSWSEFFQEVKKPRFRIAVWIEHDPPEMVDILIRASRDPAVGNCVLAIDELSLFFDSARPSEDVAGLVRFGRRQQVHFWGITQRYVDTPLIVRTQLSNVIAFRTHELPDIERLASLVGSKDQAQQVMQLPDGDYLSWDLTTRGDPERGRVRGFQQYRGNRSGGVPGGGVRFASDHPGDDAARSGLTEDPESDSEGELE